MDRLERMLTMQRELQTRVNGYEIEDQNQQMRIDNISLNVLALTDELHELLKEIGWKPWATSKHINYREARQELVDAWHFLMNLMLHLDVTAEDLWQGYHQKHKVNLRRQDDGYDGVTGKCPACKRGLSEVDVKEVHATMGALPRIDLHCACGYYLGSRPI